MIGVFSCQKEDDSFIKQEHTPQTSKTKYSITKIDYQTVQQNNRLVNSITKIKEQTGTKGSSTQNRLVHSSTYNFYIDTDVATYMENANGSYHSYTFLVIRDNPTVALENILFSLQADGTYKVSIVSYDITESEREALLNRQYIDLTNKIAKEDIDGLELVDDVFNKEVQTSFTWSYVCECDISEHIGGVDPNTGNLCNCVGIQISITNGTGENNDGNNPGGFPDNNENPHEYPDNSDVPDGENNPGGGVPDSPTTTEEEATTPVVTIPYAQNLIDCFGLDDYENANLDVSEWIYESDNFFQMRDVSSYVDRNNCSTEAQSFAMEAIEAMNNGGKFDHINNVILDSTFVANEKLNCVYNKLKADNSSLFRETVGAFIDNPSANLIFTVGNCTTTNDACTDDNYFAETGIIKITIEDVNTNPIEIAALILHEAIHAELCKYVYDYQTGLDFNNRPVLFQWYKFYSESNVPDHHLNHPYMSAYYVDNIANALRTYDNYSYPLDYYKSFAWQGLENWDVNNLLTDELENLYYQYVPTVINNSEVCID